MTIHSVPIFGEHEEWEKCHQPPHWVFEMNPSSVPLEQLALVELANIFAQFPQQDAYTFGSEGLREMIQQKKLAELAEFQVYDHETVSALCLEMVEQHPDEVTVLLWDKKLAKKCMGLLCGTRLDGVEMSDHQVEALARAILNAGHEMDLNNTEWPSGVRQLLLDRITSFNDYWCSKVEKFKEAPPKNGLPIFPSSGKPFLSLSEKRSAENLIGKLGEIEKGFTGMHLAEAIKDGRKLVLDKVNEGIAPLDCTTLENRCQQARRVRDEHVVQCFASQWGGMLAQLASFVAPGDNRSYALSFSLAGDFSDVRHMTFFLEKSLEKGEMALKVSLYDPQVSGDTSHLRVLPEHLVKLSFHDFDLRQAFPPGTVDVLNLTVDDPQLARSLTEKLQFIPNESKALVSSILNALAYGNQYGLELAANRLVRLYPYPFNAPIKDLNDRAGDLALALYSALEDDRAAAIHVLRDSVLMMGPLTPGTLEEVVWAKNRRGQPGLSVAIDNLSVKAIKAWSSLLASASFSVDASRKILFSPHVVVSFQDLSKRTEDQALAVREALVGSGYADGLKDLMKSPLIVLAPFVRKTPDGVKFVNRGPGSLIPDVKRNVRPIEEMSLTKDPFFNQGGVVRVGVDEVPDVYVREFGKSRDSLGMYLFSRCHALNTGIGGQAIQHRQKRDVHGKERGGNFLVPDVLNGVGAGVRCHRPRP